MVTPIQQIIDYRVVGHETWERMTKATTGFLAQQIALRKQALIPLIGSFRAQTEAIAQARIALRKGQISTSEFAEITRGLTPEIEGVMKRVIGFERAQRLTSATIASASKDLAMYTEVAHKQGLITAQTRKELLAQSKVLMTQADLLKEAEMRTRDMAGSQFGMMRHTERATYALNAMSAAAHGAMLGMSLARGQIMGAAFSVIFLRFSVVKLVLLFGGLAAAIVVITRLMRGITRMFIYFGKETPRVMRAVNRLQREWATGLREVRRALGPLYEEGIVPLIRDLARLTRIMLRTVTGFLKWEPIAALMTVTAQHLKVILAVLAVTTLYLGTTMLFAAKTMISYMIAQLATTSEAAAASVRMFREMIAVTRRAIITGLRFGWILRTETILLTKREAAQFKGIVTDKIAEAQTKRLAKAHLYQSVAIKRGLIPAITAKIAKLKAAIASLFAYSAATKTATGATGAFTIATRGLTAALTWLYRKLLPWIALGLAIAYPIYLIGVYLYTWIELLRGVITPIEMVTRMWERMIRPLKIIGGLLGFSPGLGDVFQKLERFTRRFLVPTFRTLLFAFQGLNVWAKILAPALYGVHVALAWLKRGTEETTREMEIAEIRLPAWMTSVEWWEQKFRAVWEWMMRFYEDKIPLWMKSADWWIGKFADILESLPEWMRSASWWEDTVFRGVKTWWDAFLEFLPPWMKSARWWSEHIPSWTEIWVALPLWMKSARWWSENVWGEVERWWNRFYEFLPDWMKDIDWWTRNIKDILEGLPEWMKSADWWESTVFRFVKDWWEGFVDFLPEFMKSARWWKDNLLDPWELLFRGLPEWLWDDLWWRDTVFGFVKEWWDKFLDFLPEWMKSADWWRRNLLSSWNLFSSLPEWMRSADWWRRNVIDPIKEAWKEFAEWIRDLLPSITIDFGFFARGAERGIQALEVNTRKFVARAEATVRATQRALASVRALPGMTAELIEQYFRPPIVAREAPRVWAQRGAIITRPTTVRVGEAGPEAIIPLRRRGAIPSIVINITGNYILDELTARTLADAVSSAIMRKLHTYYPYSIGR